MKSPAKEQSLFRSVTISCLLGMAIAGFSCSAQTAAKRPVVSWKVDPVGPGQTLLLFGDGFKDAQVRAVRLPDGQVSVPGLASVFIPASAEALQVLQTGDQCLKVEVPKTWRPGAYAIRLESPAGVGAPIVMNRPQAWWLMGDQGAAATTGAEVRVFGKNFKIDEERAALGKVVLRDAKGTFHTLKSSGLNPYALTVRIPAATALGQAAIFVHNGHGGAAGWSDPLMLEIKKPDPWPTVVFNVHDFGAKGDSQTDDTAAIRAALDKSREQGGGVVFLPRGIYSVAGQLTIPPRTVLRGEGRDLAYLIVPHDTPQFNALIAGNSEFAVEDLSLVGRMPWRMIVAPDVPSMYTGYKPWGTPGPSRAHDVFLRRLRIEQLRYESRVGTVAKDPRRSEDVGPSTIVLAGAHLEISDSEIVSAGLPFFLHDIRSSRVSGNLLKVGRNGGYLFGGARQTIFEGNTVTGGDLEANYGGFGNYSTDDGTDVSQLYIADNKFLDGYGGEREALTFDTPGDFPWKGRISRAGASDLSVDGTAWQKDAFQGLACIIAAGKGLGQHRRIVSNTAGQLVVDRPWDVLPDASSVASIGPYRRDVVAYRNQSQDASVGVQLWGGGYNYIIDGNKTTRTSGFWGTSAEYNKPNTRLQHTFLPIYFTQWLNNTITQPFSYTKQYDGDFGMWGVLGLFTRDTLATPDAAVLNYGNLFRGNSISDHSRILLGYATGHRGAARGKLNSRPPIGLDNVIEENNIRNAPLGIEIEPGYESTLIRNNHFVGVDEPIRQGKWSDPAK